MKRTVLVVDDEAAVRELIAAFLPGHGYDVIQADDGEKALRLFDKRSPELSVLDLNLPGLPGLELLNTLKQRDPSHPIIIISAEAELEPAVQAIKAGASEYLRKPINLDSLKLAVDKALTEKRLESTLTHLVREKELEFRQEAVIGESPAIKSVFMTVQKVANSPAMTVLITGESGTGKEVVAKAIHYFSPQMDKPFLEINCTAVPEALMESELFGHERGAFTDAKTRKQGLLELADGGTFFLDEIGEMPLSLQAKLLKVIDERTFRRIGGVKNIQVDVRIIAATNADLEQRVAEGRFRADLYYRLNVIAIHLPPLRERGQDIHLLATHFLNHFNRSYRRSVRGFSDDALHLLNAYPWPGNVRELRNAVERAVMINGSGSISPQDLNIERRMIPRGQSGLAIRGTNVVSLPDEGVSLDEVERDLIVKALQKCDWNVSKTARFLRISRQTLRYRVKRYRLAQTELEELVV